MSKFADQLRARSRARMKRIEVPEWGDEDGPAVIFCSPFTLADLKKISKFSKRDTLEGLAYTIIFKAMDEQGNPRFDLEDKHYLMNDMDSDVLTEIARQMNESEGFDDQLKN